MDYSKYFSILEYYKKVVQPTNPSHYKVKSEKMMVCPLHADVNPSMGIIHGSAGTELYHCFGCGRWGDVVDLNIKVQRRLFRRHLNEEESLKDLCRIFGVKYESLPKASKESEKSKSAQQEQKLLEAQSKFDFSDFKTRLIQGKIEKKGIPYFNTLMMVMISELK